MLTSSEEDLISFSSRQKYLSDINFIFGRSIFEYDIKQANINALLACNRISKDQYNYLTKVPKNIREVTIGNMIKEDKSVYSDIQKVICQAKYLFMKQNEIQIPQVLRIANDSIYVQTPIDNFNKVVMINDAPLEFVMKNHFYNYLKLSPHLLIFLNSNGDYWNIDVKGINQDNYSLHNSMITAICDLIDARNNGGKEIAISEFNRLYSSYITGSLSIDYYREFNSESMYRLKNGLVSGDCRIFNIPTYSGINVSQLDISYNLGLLRVLYSYLLQS